MANFPPLRMAVLTGLIGLKDHLDSLDDPTCPYDGETKTALRELLAPKTIEKIVEKEVQVAPKTGRGRPSKDIQLSSEDQQMVLDEIKGQVESLKTMGSDTQLDTGQRIQIAKTKTSLIAELLKMMERHTTVIKMEAFKEEVLKILDDLVSEKDRELFLRRLEQFR